VQTTLTAKIDEALEARLTKLEAATGRSRDSLVAEALRGFVESEEAFVAAVEAGRADVAEGRIVDHATVVATFERIVGRLR
jgi:predicted transcriptional regulator